MTILPTSVPIWVSLAFILTFPIVILLIANTAQKAAITANLGDSKAAKIRFAIIAFCSIFFLYVAVLSLLGVFLVNTLPPRIFLFTTIPLLIFYFGFVFRQKIYWTLLENVRLESLIRIHIFRLVGAFFLITYAYGALPKTFALVGGIGDIFAAVTAIFVANAIEKRTSYSHKLALVWNIIGFWDIINVVVSAILTAKGSISEGTQGLTEFGNFPFSWIPAFAPATIIFLHITIFKKLYSYKKSLEVQ
jgi:hypothetical protein